ncbi:MAG: hypothetical protein ACD_72C00545G0002 [uncultured bacterium]|nr:MAG: hypothetical protein ACD_72C00545G0002 [uncultured bacterium]
MFDFSFIDLDDTLYNTYILKEDIFKCFSKCGVTRDAYKQSYNEAVFGPVVGYFDYTFKKHADILRDMNYEIPDSTVEDLNNLTNKNYNDFQAERFLIDIKKISNKLILLTAGKKEFQQKKINSTGLDKYFDEIAIIDGGKSQKIVDIVGQSKKILFVNDNLSENIKIKEDLPYVLVVAKKHKVLWDDDDYQNNNDLPFFDSLIEIKDYAVRSL